MRRQLVKDILATIMISSGLAIMTNNPKSNWVILALPLFIIGLDLRYKWDE